MTLYVPNFRKLLTNNENNKPLRMKTSAITGEDSSPLYIKKYLPLEDKMRLVSSICNGSDHKKGTVFEMLRIYYIAKNYLDDVNFPQKEVTDTVVDGNGKEKEITKRIDDIHQIVDIVMGSEVWENIIAHAGKDIAIVDKWIDGEIEEYKSATTITRQLETLIGHVDDLVTDAIENGFTEKMLQEAQKLSNALTDPQKNKNAKDIIKMIDMERNKSD
ncbi:MAG: hypothetical protein ACLFPS_09020 [Clostridia bacterium]